MTPDHDNDVRPKPPDLQQWIEKYGGYWNIPWPEWDAANIEYQHFYRAGLARPPGEANRNAVKRRVRRR